MITKTIAFMIFVELIGIVSSLFWRNENIQNVNINELSIAIIWPIRLIFNIIKNIFNEIVNLMKFSA